MLSCGFDIIYKEKIMLSFQTQCESGGRRSFGVAENRCGCGQNAAQRGLMVLVD